MSKMKHLLRKLHIGNDHHHNHRTTSSQPTNTNTTPSFQSNPNSTSFRSTSPSTRFSAADSPSSSAVATAESDGSSAAAAEDFSFFEEEFQMQLALAISVSSETVVAREAEAETAQITAAKQRSLGRAPTEPLVEFLSLRYWSNNVVNYDERVMDGFYDVYGISSNSVTQGTMPLLVDLESISVSDNVDYEVILVNRASDKKLQQLEERVCCISVESQAFGVGYIDSLIQKLANIVVVAMGGPVSDADEMLRRWNLRSYELRTSLNTIILPLGCLDIGLSRHRALLFKVLADKVNLPCSLVKGSYYTGTDDGAVNLIKFDNGSEYILDLMGAPGTLIPAEVPSCNLLNFGLDASSAREVSERSKYPSSVLEERKDCPAVFTDTDEVGKSICSTSVVASAVGTELPGADGIVMEKNQKDRFKHEFGKLLPPLSRSHDATPGINGQSSPAQKLQVKDVSKCVISAARNPDFAQKLHAVLVTSGTQSSDLLPNTIQWGQGGECINGNFHLSNVERLDNGAPCSSAITLCNNDQYFNTDHDRLHLQQKEMVNNVGRSTCDVTNSFMLDCSGTYLPNDNTVNPFGWQPKKFVAGGGPFYKNQEEKLNKNFGEGVSDLKFLDSSDVGRPIPPAIHSDSSAVTKVDWEILWEDLQIGERIGIGSFGEVYRAEWNGTEVAVKKFMNQDITGDALAQFKAEIEIMLRLRHPNVVLFMGAVTHPPNLSILTEFLPRGSLFKLLHRPTTQLDEKRRMRMALDVAKGMNYLHTSNPVVVHRDLKTPNLLVDKNWVVKVADFGMSRLKHHTFLSSKSTAGTPEWMAPEVLRNEPSNEKSDVYSFGVILWELATLRVPWTEMNSMQVVGAVGFQHRHLDIPENVDPVVAEIITDCWHPEQQSRPSFKQIISRLRSLRRLSVERTESPQTESTATLTNKRQGLHD